LFETLIPDMYSVLLGSLIGFAVGTTYMVFLSRRMMIKKFGFDVFNKDKKNH